jgi:hypothetical protein
MEESMNILGEMKRRNLYRVGMVYIVAGWILIQGGYALSGYFAAPGWMMAVFIALLVLGFPAIMYFAWSYERTR